MTTREKFLETLRLIPDDVVLSMATRPIAMEDIDPQTCVCGWATRELWAREVNGNADDKYPGSVLSYLSSKFSYAAMESWNSIFGVLGVRDDIEALELAFTERVLEAI